MEIAGVKIDHIADKNSGKLDVNFMENKKHRLGAANSLNSSSAVAQPKGASAKAAAAQPKTPFQNFTPKEMKLLSDKAENNSRPPPQVTQTLLEKEIQEKIYHQNCIANYKTKAATRTIPGMAQIQIPHLMDPLAAHRAIHAECKKLCNKTGAEAVIRSMIGFVPLVMEKAVMEYGLNPGGDLDLTGFSQGWAKATEEDKEVMEPEATEIVIEWEDTFAAPSYLRLIQKMAQLAYAYSENRKRGSFRAATAPAGSNLKSKFGDL